MGDNWFGHSCPPVRVRLDQRGCAEECKDYNTDRKELLYVEYVEETPPTCSTLLSLPVTTPTLERQKPLSQERQNTSAVGS